MGSNKITFRLSFILCFLLFTVSLNAQTYYLSPTGADTNSGITETQPWATFSYAFTKMKGGDTLVLLDGTYEQELHPPASLSGTQSAFTTFKAKNPGNVILAPKSIGDDEMEGVIYLYSSPSRGIVSYIHFDGLFAKGVGEDAAISIASHDFALENEMTHHIKITRCGAMGAALDYNTGVFEVGGVRDVLIEDCFAFGFGRKAMQLYGARHITVRRVVVRYDWWEGDKYKPSDPRVNLSAYNTIDAVLENIIALDAGPHPSSTSPDRAGLVVSGNQGGGTAIDGSQNVKYLGCLVFNNNVYAKGLNGFEINGGTGSPVKNITIKDIVIYGADAGFNIHDNVDTITVENVTSIHNTHIGIRIEHYPSYSISNVEIKNCLATDNKYDGIWWSNEMATVSNSTSIRNGEGDNIETEFEPEIKYLPTNTPVAGHKRGGVVMKKYYDGVLTNEPLWPWPHEDVIKKFMCNTIYLKEIEDTINNYEHTTISYLPGLCQSDKSLTNYIWSFLGNACPSEICNGITSLSDISGEGSFAKIYPNPTKDLLNISIPENLQVQKISIFDLSGKKVFVTKNKPSQINVSALKKGIYIFEVTFNNTTQRKKLIKL